MDYKTTRSNATLKLILVIVFLALAVTITFVIGYGVGRFAGNSSTPSGSNDSRMNTLQAVYDILAKDFYYGEDSEDYRSKLIDDAINGMVDAQGDIHTDYMTPEEVRQFNGALESNIVGIGIRYTELDGQILVLEVLRDSPAEKAGIQEGDIITAVDGVSCRESSVDYVTNLVRGQIGTSVRISIDRMGIPVELTAVRAVIGTTVSSEVRDGIGVLRISSFGDQTSEELGEHLKYLEDNKVTRYIIDLRNNGGGYAQTLDKMCAYFMNNGEIVMVEEDRDGRQIIDKVKNSQKIKYDKIVILINESSASCSEVFTMALKENCGAVTVG
ncbi:MAG: PDZ domain-containing protein, partial [Erysipelotrichaceae bacterium]|nr:PDZ domain-containing protein [Erysipelotrichaceae bacterium]